MDCRNRELDFWDEVLEKPIEAESKASLQPPTGTQEMDARCLRGRRPPKKDEITSSSKFLSSMKDPRGEESKARTPEPTAPQHTAETSDKARKEKKGRRN